MPPIISQILKLQLQLHLHIPWVYPLQTPAHFSTTCPLSTHFSISAGRVKLCWSEGALHARWVSARRHPQNGVLGVHPSGVRNDWSLRVPNRDWRENKFKVRTSARKLMTSVFWESEDILLVELLKRESESEAKKKKEFEEFDQTRRRIKSSSSLQSRLSTLRLPSFRTSKR
jgi:hypothetical protein